MSVMTAIPMSAVQFIKIQKQNDFKNKYSDIIKYNYNKYGVQIFFRGVVPYSTIIGLSVVVYPIALIMNKYFYGNIFVSAVTLTIISAMIETAATIYFETKEILRNKIKNFTNMGIISILYPSFIRNFINWLPVTFSDELLRYDVISFTNAATYSFFFGFVAGFISLPFDVYLTRKYGEDEKCYSVAKFIKETRELGFYKMFTGVVPRGIQMSFYNLIIIFSGYIIKTIFYT